MDSADLKVLVEQTIDIEDVEQLDDAKKHWKIMLSMASQLKSGVIKSSGKVQALITKSQKRRKLKRKLRPL